MHICRETEQHISSAQPDTTENEVKQKKNKKKKVVQKSDEKPESDGTEESPVAEAGNDLKTSSEKWDSPC